MAPVVAVAWPVVAGGTGLAAATFLLYRAFATVGGRAVGDGRAAAHHLRWARYTVVPAGAVGGTAVFVALADAYVRAAAAVAGVVGAGADRWPVVLAAMGLWGATVLAGVAAGVRGYAPLSRRRDAGTSSRDVGRTAVAAGAYAVLLAALVALLAVEPLAAAVAVAVGRPAAAAVGPAVVRVVERTRPVPAPWDDRVSVLADRVGVSLRDARVVADGAVRVALSGLLPGRRVLFVTDRALSTLDETTVGVLVVRELARARHRATARTVTVETVPVAVWLASFGVLGAGRAIVVGAVLLAPYAAAVGLVGLRAEYAADDAAAALLGPAAVVAAVERTARANDVPERRNPVFDLLAGRPAPRRRVERLRADDADGRAAPATSASDADARAEADDAGT